MIVLPSRGRPESLRAFFESSQPMVKGVVMLDQDDAGNYEAVELPSHWSLLIGPRIGYVGMLNRAFTMYPTEPFYAYGGDDVRCRPNGWDLALAKMAGTDQISYGDDLINGEHACCLPFIGGDLVRRVGWLACPWLQHLYCDTVWRDLGRSLGVLHYAADIITEHLHFSTGKRPYDRTAQERPTRGDQAAYSNFLVHHFEETLARCTA